MANNVSIIGWQPVVIRVDVNYTLVKVENNGSETPVYTSDDRSYMERYMSKERQRDPRIHYKLIKQVSQVVLDSHPKEWE